jgi:4-diphosphocytidyl-2-C-methyl-D-erythritol kinase
VSARRALRERAPAKLNLGLRIVGRRDDGYHLLDSVFVPLAGGELEDDVDLALSEARGVSLLVEGGGAEVPGDARNLAHRAALAFLSRAGGAGHAGGVRIRLRKRIPAGAGLGGGSSDAGAVLRGLERLLPGALGDGELSDLALGLGADVPFFVRSRPARVTGIGEVLGPPPPLPRLHVVVLVPAVSLATADVYRAFAAARPTLTHPGRAPTIRAPWGARADFERTALAGRLHNDLEAVATVLCPDIGELRSILLGAGAAGVGMTGSGAAVYGVFEEGGERDSACARLELPPSVQRFRAEVPRAIEAQPVR